MSTRRIHTDEQQRSYADLVDTIAIRADHDPIAFRRTRVRLDEIRRWFIEYPGWPVVESRDMIRLIKTPATPEASQGLAWCECTLDYVLLAWLLRFEEALEGTQFVCSDLVQDLERQVNTSVDSVHFSWDVPEHRRSLARVVVALTEMGALRRVDGSIEEYARGQQDDALYEFTGLARHLHVRVPQDIDQADDPLEYALGAGRRDDAPPLQRLYRALLLQPVLYEHNDPEAFCLLRRPEVVGKIAATVSERFGWDIEIAGSYAALLRPAAHGSRNSFPRPTAAIMHVVLLICGILRIRVQQRALTPDGHDRIHMSSGSFLGELMALREEYGARWGKQLSAERVSIMELARHTLATMREWGLVERNDDENTICFLPLCARFIATYADGPIVSFEDS